METTMSPQNAPGEFGTASGSHHTPTPAPSPQEDRAALLRATTYLTNPPSPPTISGGSGDGQAQDDTGDGGSFAPLSQSSCAPGASIEHLARIVYPCHEWADARLAMFTWAFDAGGKEANHPCVTVAAFVSTAAEWIAFSGLWQARLDQDHVAYFRMSEFANWFGEFRDRDYWTESRRRALMTDLLTILQKHAFRKIGCIVTRDAVSALSSEAKELWRLNAYVAGARVCCAGIRLWAQRDQHTAPMEYVFEEGDETPGMLTERLILDGFPRPIFRPKKDQARDGMPAVYGYRPLQAADILAYELFKLQTDPAHTRLAIRRELDSVIGPIRRMRVDHVEGLERELWHYAAAAESVERLSDLLRQRGMRDG